MKLEVTISSLAVLDTVISGVTSGLPWARNSRCWIPSRSGLAMDSANDLPLVCELVERDTGAQISLKGPWAPAVRLMSERYPVRFAELMTGRTDPSTGSVLIQLAAFGEVRYG